MCIPILYIYIQATLDYLTPWGNLQCDLSMATAIGRPH